MLEAIISYLQQSLQLIYPDIEVKGLAFTKSDTDGGVAVEYPGEYCTGGESKHINIDFHKGLVYFRQNGDMRARRLSADETVDFNIYEERTYPLRVVAAIPKDIYKTDNAFIADKIAENFTKAVTVQSKKVLLDTLSGADDVNISVTSRITDDVKVWQEEYSGIEFNAPSTMQLLALDIEVIITASLECFEYWGCRDEPLELQITNPVTLLYEDNTVFQVFQQTPFTINDNRIYNNDGTLNRTIKPEESLTLPPAITCSPVTLVNSVGTVIEEVPSGSEKELSDGIAKNTLNETVGTAPYSTNIIVGNSIIFDATGLTPLISLAAANNLTTTQIIALMTAAQVLADANSANLTNSIVPLLTGGSGNLANLSTAQLQALLQTQLQQITFVQLDTLSTEQKNYIYTQLPVTSYERPVRSHSLSSAHLYDGYWIRENVLNDAPTGKVNIVDPLNANLLVYNNVFGNKNKFTDALGGQAFSTYGNYAIEHKSGLGYYLLSRPIKTWDAALDDYTTFTLNVNGQILSNFFVPDMNIVYSLRRHDNSFGLPSIFTVSNNFWTGTAAPNDMATRALRIINDGRIDSVARSGSNLYILCRKHYSN